MREPTEQAVQEASHTFKGHGGMMKTSEALEAGIHRRTLYWMRDSGLLEQLSRGVYHLASEPLPEKPDLVVVAKRVPEAVFCLLTALDYHGIGTQIPRYVDIALPRTVTAPKVDYPPVRVFRMEKSVIEAGIETTQIDTTRIRVFSVAKTVADCFRYRSRVGVDVAVEALRDAVLTRRVAAAEVMRFAEIDKVAHIVRPYLEALQ